MSGPMLVLNCGSSSIKLRARVERRTGGRPPAAARSRVLVAVEPKPTNEEWIPASHAERVLCGEMADVPQP